MMTFEEMCTDLGIDTREIENETRVKREALRRKAEQNRKENEEIFESILSLNSTVSGMEALFK